MITIWVPKRLVEVGLYNVAARSPQELAALSEQSYRDRVKYAAEKVRLSGTKIVMLTGPSASGKTTSAHKLAEELIRQGTSGNHEFDAAGEAIRRQLDAITLPEVQDFIREFVPSFSLTLDELNQPGGNQA